MKIDKFCIIAVTIILLTGCGSKTATRNINKTQTIDDIIESKYQSIEVSNNQVNYNADSEYAEPTITNNADAVAELTTSNGYNENTMYLEKTTYSNIDHDLTKLDANLVYSIVFDMINNTGNYMGKVVKIKGYTSIYHDPFTDKEYYTCIIPDATACCAQGIEFRLNSTYHKFNDYPMDGQEITLVGTFSTYYEDDMQYMELKESEILLN